MGALLLIAWRNIWRNKRRTIINMVAIGLGLALVVFYGGIMAGMMGQATTQLDTSGLGHVELSASGWRQHRSVKEALHEPAALRARLELPPGAEVSARLVVRGLVSSANGNEAVELHGVDFTDEALVAEYARTLTAGAAPAAGDPMGILVGDALAERLKVGVGSKVRVMSQRTDGEMGAQMFRVRGIFHAMTSGISRHRVLVPLAAASTLSGVEGVHQIVIQLIDPSQAAPLARRLRTAVGPGVDVATYAELFPIYATLEKLMDSVTLYAAGFIYLLVGLGILNTMLMSVLERTREFGVLQALGTRPSGVVALVLAESFWIATLSVGLGLALGLGITWYGSTHVLLDYTKAMGEAFDYGGAVMKSAFITRFAPLEAVKAAGAVYVMALLVGLVPAWRVSRMRPVDAIHAR